MRGVYWPADCPFCRLQGNHEPDTRTHAWQCPGTRDHVDQLLEELYGRLKHNWYKSRGGEQLITREIWSATHVVIWTMATTTEAIKKEKIPVGGQDAMGVRFIRQVLDASINLHEHRAKCREEILKTQTGENQTLKQAMMEALMGREEDEPPAAEEEDPEDEVSTDEAGWSTDDSISAAGEDEGGQSTESEEEYDEYGCDMQSTDGKDEKGDCQ